MTSVTCVWSHFTSQGPNCGTIIASMLGSRKASSTVVIPAASIAAAVLAITAMYILHRYKLQKASLRFMKPHTFQEEMKAVTERGLAANPDDSVKIRYVL